MRWLLLVLLISVVGLLLAALGLARFIWKRVRRGSKPSQGTAKASVQTGETSAKTKL
jgi:hypothetical protein